MAIINAEISSKLSTGEKIKVYKRTRKGQSGVKTQYFTVTNDLDAAFPAKALRELGHSQLSAIDTKAPNVVNDLEGCIRVLVTYKDEIEVTHTYLGEAKNLRPDR
jgi:chorismate mutase